MCREFADHVAWERKAADDSILLDDGSADSNRAGALERIYFNEILESAPWEVIMRTACGARREHINILEVRACLRVMGRQLRPKFGTRQIYGLDSQVGLGALIKGRSPSRVINDELRLGLPNLVGIRHYPGYYFAPTRINPADCPTRDKDVPSPRGIPAYIADLAADRTDAFDKWSAVALQTRSCSNWARFYLRLLWPVALQAWPWQ